MAALGAAAAIYNRLAASAAETAHPPDGKFITVNGVRLHEMLQQSRLWLLRGAGHMPHYSSPGAVVDAIDYVAGRAAVAWGRGLARVSSQVP